MFKFSRLILTFLFATTINFSQQVYYVSPGGDDSKNGSDPDNAFATLQHAADLAEAGDSVKVLPGNYTGFDIRSSGTSGEAIVFKAEGDAVIDTRNSETPDGINIENASWLVIDGFTVINQERAGIRAVVSEFITIRNNSCNNNGRWGIFTGFADDLLIENNTCSNSNLEHGIYVSNSGDRPVVRYNRCFQNNGCGLHFNGDESMGGDGIISNAVIHGNILYENGTGGGSAINMDGVQESAVFNNLIYNNHATGIALYRIDGAEGSKNNKIFNNTIINPADARWGIINNNGSSGNILYNNIIINHHNFRGSISIDESSAPGFVSNYNLFSPSFSDDDGETAMDLESWQNLGYDSESEAVLSEELIFTDFQNGNFHLLNGSQPVDKGTSFVSDIVKEDLTGLTRPQGEGYDIGAYEHNSTTDVKESELPISFYLYQNYPNPFNPVTTISWQMQSTVHVSLKVFDLLGKEIAVLADGEYPAGNRNIQFNAGNLPSGVYFYTLSAGGESTTKRFMLVK